MYCGFVVYVAVHVDWVKLPVSARENDALMF
jgi:hypothetical protein